MVQSNVEDIFKFGNLIGDFGIIEKEKFEKELYPAGFSYYRQCFAGEVLARRDRVTVSPTCQISVERAYDIYHPIRIDEKTRALNSFGQLMFNNIEEGHNED